VPALSVLARESEHESFCIENEDGVSAVFAIVREKALSSIASTVFGHSALRHDMHFIAQLLRCEALRSHHSIHLLKTN
jgi:hypothetical protein